MAVSSVRCVHMARSATFVYMSPEELLSPGVTGVDRIEYDKLLIGEGLYYRAIIRSSSDYSIRPKERAVARDNDHIYRLIRDQLSFCKYYSRYTMVLVKYTDDTFTTLMDIPLDDPMVCPDEIFL